MKHCERSGWYFASSDLYQVLGCFVTQTSPDLARAVYSGALAEDVGSIVRELGYSEAVAASLLEALEDARRGAASEDDLFHAIRRDYTRLFSNPTFSAMTLFESRMSGPDKDARGNRIFFGRTVPSARALYRRAGFESSITPKLREDHAAVEFEFMQVLRQNQGVALRDGDLGSFDQISRSVDDFASSHIGRWAVPFFEDMERHASEGVYRAIGRIGAQFMRDDLGPQRARAIA